MKNFFILVSFVFLSFGLAAQDGKEFKTQLNNPIPEFEFTPLDSEKIHIKDYQGKVVLLNFYASWCGPCRREMPVLDKALKNEKDLIILAIARGEDVSKVREFKDEHNYSFVFAPDQDKSVYQLFADKYIPRNLVINKEGQIIYQSTGYDVEKLNSMIDLIKKELK